MKDKRNIGKKTLAAVGAVVAAGLTPGFVAASAAGAALQAPNAPFSAADVVSIDGTTYSFDELYAMQREETVDTIVMPDIILELDTSAIDVPVVVAMGTTKYGAPWLKRNAAQPKGIDDTVYRSVEQMPRFQGGEAALMKYINSHINYPPAAAMNKIEGNVVVQFVVKKDGSIGEVKVVRSVEKNLDREAVRVIKSLPKFTPGRQNGEAVNVWYTLPVPFKLK